MSEDQVRQFRSIQDDLYEQLRTLCNHEWMDDKGQSKVKHIILDLADLCFSVEANKSKMPENDLEELRALLGGLNKLLLALAQHKWLNDEFRWKVQQFIKDVSFASVQLEKNHDSGAHNE